jgi:hypothetical protein
MYRRLIRGRFTWICPWICCAHQIHGIFSIFSTFRYNVMRFFLQIYNFFNLHTNMLNNRFSTMSPMVSYYSIPMEVAQIWWKEKNFSSVLHSFIGMKFRKRKHIFIKDYISEDIYTPCGNI